jgi:hypothetical protein
MPTCTRGILCRTLTGLAVLIGAAIGPVNAAVPDASTNVSGVERSAIMSLDDASSIAVAGVAHYPKRHH